MKLQIIVPVYKEPFSVLKPLLDSIAIQQNVNFDDIGVIICSDGPDSPIHTADITNQHYPFDVMYRELPHRGVSATRNSGLDLAKADYVMFCDSDDMFFNACGLYIIFREIDNGGFDSFVSSFLEETRDPTTKAPIYINRDMDSTFVHGKVHRRQYLIDNSIRWNESLTIHEDSYFNILCQKLSANVKYCPSPFYLWKWRDDSVCRHDPKYILKTYNNMLDSNTALVEQFLKRFKMPEAQMYVCSMIYDAYFTLNKDEWITQENQEYRDAVEKRFKQYYKQFKQLFDAVPQDARLQIVAGIRSRMYGEGLLMEHVTFDDWIEKISS